MKKEALYIQCLEILQSRIKELDAEIASLKEAKLKETKSTAGDKYETGRAMLQAEEDRLMERKSISQNMLHHLKELDISNRKEKVGPGSLVEAGGNYYFISVALGKILFYDEPVFCISGVSPIGKALMGASEQEKVNFNGKVILIEKLI
jgi:hypothetical protein